MERSFLLPFADLADAIAARDAFCAARCSPPPSICSIPPPARHARQFGLAAGRARRRQRRRDATATSANSLQLADGLAFEERAPGHPLAAHRKLHPAFLAAHHDGAVVRASCTLKESEAVMESFPGPAIARAGNGVCYGYFEQSRRRRRVDGRRGADKASRAVDRIRARTRPRRHWSCGLSVAGDFEIMKRVKQLFDPANLLNRGRLYRRI